MVWRKSRDPFSIYPLTSIETPLYLWFIRLWKHSFCEEVFVPLPSDMNSTFLKLKSLNLYLLTCLKENEITTIELRKRGVTETDQLTMMTHKYWDEFIKEEDFGKDFEYRTSERERERETVCMCVCVSLRPKPKPREWHVRKFQDRYVNSALNYSV